MPREPKAPMHQPVIPAGGSRQQLIDLCKNVETVVNDCLIRPNPYRDPRIAVWAVA